MTSPEIQTKTKVGIAASWKMYSVRFVALFSALAAMVLAWFQSLPASCAGIAGCTLGQAEILAKMGVSVAFVPLVAGFVTWYLRIKPQSNITPADAAAKSEDAPQPPSEPPPS